MCLQRMKELLTDPVKAINSAKRERGLKTTFEILIIEWFIFALGVVIVTSSIGIFSAVASVVTFVGGVLATLFFSYLIMIIFNILGGRGKYEHALVSAVYAKFPLAVGFIIASIFLQLSIVGVPIAIIVGSVFAIIGVTTLYRGVKELFGVDIITAWIGISILIIGLVLAFYMSVISFSIGQNVFHPFGGQISGLFGREFMMR